jgi:hypothetical protein
MDGLAFTRNEQVVGSLKKGGGSSIFSRDDGVIQAHLETLARVPPRLVRL